MFSNLGEIYSGKKEYEKAINYFLKSLKGYTDINNNSGICRLNGLLGKIYFKTSNYKKAEEYIFKSLKCAKELSNRQQICDAYGILRDISAKKGNTKGELEYFKKYTALNDSILKEEEVKENIRLEIKYEFDRKQLADSFINIEHIKQRKLLREFKNRKDLVQHQRSMQLYVAGGIILLIVLVVLISIKVSRRNRKIS